MRLLYNKRMDVQSVYISCIRPGPFCIMVRVCYGVRTAGPRSVSMIPTQLDLSPTIPDVHCHPLKFDVERIHANEV